MSLRKRLTAENALSVALATTAVTRELADMCQFPPVRAAAGLLLLIFQTIQDIQTNRTECYRLARRSLALLTDLRETMHGRCQDAPPSLLLAIHKFEHTLEEMHTALKASAEHKWHSRLIKKNSIEAAIADFNLQLDDAARSFQIATLINIQYELATSAPLCESPTAAASIALTPNGTSSDDEFVLVSTSDALPAAQSLQQQPRDTTTQQLTEEEAIAQMTKDLKDHGFRRFHTSDLSFTSSSAISTSTTDWWSTARDGVSLRTTTDDANSSYSESVLYMPYHAGTRTAAAQKWLQDVKILQNVHHPNLPQMIGYSGDSAPTPFILLANVQTRLPQALVLDAIQNASLLSCARLLIRYYKDIFDASVYIQRQLGLSESKTQDYVENASLRIDASDTMVLGLPPPDIHNWTSYRNYGLAHSIREIFLKILPNHGYARQPYDPDSTTSLEVQQKVSHLAVLAKSLLPSSDDSALVSSRLSSILYYSRPSIPFSRGGGGDDDDDEGEEEGEDHDDGRIAKGQPTAGLAKIRMAAILANTHSHTWARNVVPAYMYAVGDIGYVPRAGGEDVTSFVVLSNVFTAPDAERFDRRGNACLGVSESAHGWQRYLQGAFQEQKLQPFALPQNAVSGWPIVLSAGTRQNVQLVHERSFTSVSAAWKVLLEHAKPIATSHGLEPQDLMLITRAGIDQRFVVHDLRSPPPPLHNPHFHSPHHHRPGFPQHQHQQMMHGYGAGGHRPPGFSGFGAPAPPALFYLFTSPEQGFEPYISETPMYVPVPEGTKRPDVRQCLCGMEGTYGFMNYVQLHAEDFV